MQTTAQTYTRTTPIETVRNDPVFGDYGRLIFPVERSYYSGDTLEELQLTYYSHIDPDETVEIVNTLRERAADGQTIFYDIYTDEEKAADPAKEDTGLFFFKGVKCGANTATIQILGQWKPTSPVNGQWMMS